MPENRWDRVDIKTVGLLPNVLAKEKAKEAGAQEAWFVDTDGIVKEGGSSNAWIVTKDGALVTRPAEHGILRGITRTTLFDVARKARPEDRGARLLRGRGQGGARGLHQFGDDHRHAGRRDRRRAGRQRPSGLGRTFACAQAFFDIAEKSLA